MHMQGNTAAEHGSIPPQLIKYGTDRLYEQLTKLFQDCVNGNDIPNE